MTAAQPNSADVQKWLRLVRAEGVGPVTFRKMVERFGSLDRAIGASASELARVNGIGPATAEKIAATRDNFDVGAELALAEELDVWLVTLEDNRYPAVLKQIYDPPPVLYVKGTLSRSDSLAVSIVGSRRCSLYGQEQSARLAHFLASACFTICSGMARGIDTYAHQGALAAGGRTIAVQGCGLAKIFPPENRQLFEKIAESGACISELPLHTEPLSENFPPRNRIIAGLALGTIVVEAGLRSGALITARAALDYNREVMAVPGKVDSPLSKGAHQLLKQGARLVESIEDVLEALGYIGQQLQPHASRAAEQAAARAQKPSSQPRALNLSSDQESIYEQLGKEPLHIEQLIAGTGLPAGKVNAGLIALQLMGLVRQLPGSLFARK